MPNIGPTPTDTLVVIADIHGNHATLRKLLLEAGVIDFAGHRQPGFWVCQVGDLIHGGHDVLIADYDTLMLSQEWIDCQLVGNHDAPFIGSAGGSFSYMHRAPGTDMAYHPTCQRELWETRDDGRWQVAVQARGWLITHAGLAPLAMDDELRSIKGDPAALADALNARYEARNSGGEPDPVLDSIGMKRGGGAAVGGVIWCDWNELTDSVNMFGSTLKQMVGHSHQPPIPGFPGGNHPRSFDRDGAPQMWCIDLKGVDMGHTACMVMKPGENQWTAVVVENDPRPTKAIA